MGFQALPRMLATLAAAAVALLALAAVLPGFAVSSFWAALLAAAIGGAVNALLWPVLIRLALPLTVLTLGAGALLLNALVLLLVARVTPGVELDDIGSALVLGIGLALVATVTAGLLGIDDDVRVLRAELRAARRQPRDPDAPPGVVLCEIDGLAHDVLRRALRDGNTPTLARWVHDGGHRLHAWETDWSSQTGACQAGLLHGSNHDIPAFRWWEKERGGAIVTNHPRDAAELERRVSDGRGLLHAGGASRANILSGDAPHSLLTMSTVLDRDRPGRVGQDYFSYFSRPASITRTLVRALGDIAVELRASAQQRRHDVRPRIDRRPAYALMRAWATAIQLDLQVASVMGDLRAGRPVIYTTFLAYDEVVHHSGIERPDTLATLRRVDRAIARIAAVAEAAPRRYELVVLADHGQTQGATFRQRYGQTLDALVARACGIAAERVDAPGSGEDEASGRLGAALTEAAAGPGPGAHAVRVVARGRIEAARGSAGGEPARAAAAGATAGDESAGAAAGATAGAAAADVPELAVMASGCLGLISFPRLPGRVTRETIDARWPSLLDTLRAHPGIGFVLVRSATHGALVLGADGEHRLDAGHVLGADPLAPFGPNAAAHVRRTDRFPHCPDLLVNSTWWPDTEEVAAFEELVGSHGGLGGPQSHPFVLAPARLAWPDEPIVGAEAVHRILRGWLADLGHDAYREAVPT